MGFVHTICVASVPGGWLVSCDLLTCPLMFFSSGHAEAQAVRFARLVARLGRSPRVLICDRQGREVAQLYPVGTPWSGIDRDQGWSLATGFEWLRSPTRGASDDRPAA